MVIEVAHIFGQVLQEHLLLLRAAAEALQTDEDPCRPPVVSTIAYRYCCLSTQSRSSHLSAQRSFGRQQALLRAARWTDIVERAYRMRTRAIVDVVEGEGRYAAFSAMLQPASGGERQKSWY